MENDQKESDIASLIEALVYKRVDEVWKEYVEEEKEVYARVYWRELFFEAIETIHPACILSIPNGKEFANMMIEFNGQN